MLRDAGVEGPHFHEAQELGQRRAGNTPAPVFFPEPVANLAFAGLFPIDNVARHLALKDDGPENTGLLGPAFCPVRHEWVARPAGKGSHAKRFRVELLLEEDGEVAFLDFAESKLVRDHAENRARGKRCEMDLRPQAEQWKM